MSASWPEVIRVATQLRRTLHSKPELTWQETATAATIRRRLDELQIPWRVCAETGTVASLNAQGAGKHIALRGDIDALPIHEQTQLAYQSQAPGCMHACGHDGHTATLLATAEWLKAHESALAGPVSLLFQPAEEGGYGACRMIDDGALEGVDCIYGWHNWPTVPFGEVVCPDGIVMCGNGLFEIEVIGAGGHASQPERCRDPVLGASAITMALQQIVSRRLSPNTTAVVSVSSIEAPSAPTVVPERARIGGSIRVPNNAVREELCTLITEIAEDTARAYGVRCEVRHDPRYDATINHAAAAARLRAVCQQLWGEQALNRSVQTPIMASEDFSYYLQKVPGAFAIIGADDGKDRHRFPCHSAHYDFNDRLIERVVALYSHLVGAPVPSAVSSAATETPISAS